MAAATAPTTLMAAFLKKRHFQRWLTVRDDDDDSDGDGYDDGDDEKGEEDGYGGGKKWRRERERKKRKRREIRMPISPTQISSTASGLLLCYNYTSTASEV
ncbi:hypothetical protein TWF718_002833 [Orbilia javanica]|uniref:Uncharacterized protein n=1 Tax=Orbilia javanica TaxID=47235 RepID=A0AAN8MNY6_9PEZI